MIAPQPTPPTIRRALRALMLAVLAAAAARGAAGAPAAADLARWQERAARVEIVRDTWGIPHVYGKTDADAVFGFLYAQAEDDFPRIERNYLNALGRLAEIAGEAELARDLRTRLFVDPDALPAKYQASPAWLRALMDAFADGLNFYLYRHPEERPQRLTRFEPWMALAFTEGSIGGDIESIALPPLARFYGLRRTARALPAPAASPVTEGTGSNGFALSPRNTVNEHALLLINPHTTFYFRPEVHVVSDEGLNAYGAATWGQLFVYQGFNDRCGWMHTSDGADVIDEYRETVVAPAGSTVPSTYQDGATQRPLVTRTVRLKYRDGAGQRERAFTTYFTRHGPVIRADGDRWITVRLLQDPIASLTQSYRGTKARSYAEFLDVLQLRTNTSNNTVYADADGNIAYFHGNFVPRRDPRFDWRRPVDGADPATDWQGLHAVAETIHLLNPASGWIQNTNNWPFSAAGESSPRRDDYPRYMWTNPENARGRNAARVLAARRDFTLERLIDAANDPLLIGFATLLPPLFADFDALAPDDARRAVLGGPIATLRAWDQRRAVDSIPTTVAVLWAHELSGGGRVREAKEQGLEVLPYLLAVSTPAARLEALQRVVARLERDFGSWRTPWGEVNRFQRLDSALDPHFDDTKPSLPVAFTASDWGSLAAFGPAADTPTRRLYGQRGNSFVAVVEFGPRVVAKSVLAGGVSGRVASPHFNDQAALYAQGRFKDVWFYRDDVDAHSERRYHPGSEAAAP